jgi:hypothetical protein
MRHHVTPPISAHHDLNRDNFEPNIDSVGTPPKRPRADRRFTLNTTACSRAQRLRPHARPRDGPVVQDPRQGRGCEYSFDQGQTDAVAQELAAVAFALLEVAQAIRDAARTDER